MVCVQYAEKTIKIISRRERGTKTTRCIKAARKNGDPNESLVRIRSVTFHSRARARGHCLASLSDSLISLP